MIFLINKCLIIKKTKIKIKIKYIAIKLECAHDDIFLLPKGAFKYYVIKEVGGWGQKMAIWMIYSTVNHRKGGRVGLKKSKT